MPGSVHIVIRTTKGGKRYIVRYRRGGRGYRLEHAGSFKRQDAAKERERLVGGWLAAGLDPREELAKLGTEEELREVSTVGREGLESRIDLSEQSSRVYTTYLESIDESPLGKADPGRITPRDVRAQVARWAAAGLASKSIRERVSVLRQVLDFAEVDPNPARHRTVKLPAKIETELVLPSAQDVVALTSNLASKYRLPFVILEQTAMRVNEVVSLERDDVDAAGLRFRVKAVNRKGRRGSRRARSVPVPGWLMEVVATSLPLSGRLFPDISADGLRSAMRDLCANKGLTRCTPHRLRHRRISLWHFQGVPARELADRAGHSRPSMSLDVYSHVIVPDEVDPETLRALVSHSQNIVKRVTRDAPVMHRGVS
jgi:integrase